MTTNDDRFDDFDLNELFTDFNENSKISSKRKRSTNDDEDFFELTENDCEQTRRPLKKSKKKIVEFTTKLSFADRRFFSSLENGSTSKKLVKTRKRTEEKIEIRSKSKKNDFEASSSTTPDFIDSLLKYLDERSRRRPSTIISDQKENKSDFC